ncbi:4990_t:CDS:2, partial [Ambispora leptoticha]
MVQFDNYLADKVIRFGEDLHWPELHDIMPRENDSVDSETNTGSAKHHSQNLINNPHSGLSLQQLTRNDAISWVNLYALHLTEIEVDFDDLLSLALDNLPNNNNQIMHLAEMGPNTVNYNFNLDLKTRHMDQNYEWTVSGKHYANIDVANFVQHASIEDRAGTEKSYLIKIICDQLNNIAIKRNSKSPILILAPTGVATYNINGITIHSALSIPIFRMCLDINREKLKQLQKRLQNINYIIIDEMSMVDHRMLAIIDVRLCQAFSEYKNIPFGSRL